MKRLFILLISAVLLTTTFSSSVSAASSSNDNDNTNGLLREMGFSEAQIELLPVDTLKTLVAYGHFNTRMIEYHISDETGNLKYFVICTPKCEVEKLSNSSKQALLNIGYSEDEIASLPIGYQVELTGEKRDDLLLCSFESSIEEVDVDISLPVKKATTGGTRGEIPSDEMSITTSIINYGTTNNLNTRRITATFTWLQDPNYKLTDKLGISYSHSWAIDSSIGGLVYQCYGEYTGNLYTFYYYDGQYTAGTGVAYESIDIKNVYNGEHVTNHSGWANLYIQHYVNQTNTSVITNVLSKYFQKKLSLNGTISLSPLPSISISNSSSYDWKQSLTSFSWVA